MIPLSGPVGGGLDRGVDLVLGHVPLEDRGQVGDRAVGHGDAEGVAGQLAVELGDHLADGLGGAGGRGDDVDRRGPGPVGVGVDLVGHALVVGVGVAWWSSGPSRSRTPRGGPWPSGPGSWSCRRRWR